MFALNSMNVKMTKMGIVGVAGGLVDHASPTLLLMPVEESLQFNLNSKYCLIVCIFDFKNLTLHILWIIHIKFYDKVAKPFKIRMIFAKFYRLMCGHCG